ncbi:MAG: aminotransferase class V-fold PLP-dependent enzyme [Oscillospiraceae bacterium]|nr:aminotransferase class V-fold PLP-dependent enzyme [Oscillospiraceae bacterium]
MTVYLDSGATTLQKPPSVARAMAMAVSRMASPGRGGHRPSMLAAETAFLCRQTAAELFHVEELENVVFTCSATHALNLAIKSVVAPGDTVVVSGYEHNAVTRPLQALGCTIRVAQGKLFNQGAVLADFDRLITPEVSCVICTHVSNVFGFILPVSEIAELCRTRRVPLILDASQSAGVLPVHMDELGCAYVGMPGHKGLYGPQGIGLLLCGKGQMPQPLMEGGTGSLSNLQGMPDFLPDRLEAGTHNVPGIAGLLEGIRYVRARGEAAILKRERLLTAQAVRRLSGLPGVTVYASSDPEIQTGVVSFRVEGKDCEEIGERLGQKNIAVRTGLHCAPFAHRSAGTLETGTVRVSFSDFNHPGEVGQLVSAVAQIIK